MTEPPAAATEPARFGRLEPVQLRTYWRDKARDFTPWLAKEENLTLLGDVIGMTLELAAVEQYIGPFRADIIACFRGHRAGIAGVARQSCVGDRARAAARRTPQTRRRA